ncbi:CHAT domain-containing protein [Desulfopila sp. IMCC35006]|uniref:CHAT domain-containing tetratricopeptide repeat protein n=1 Tax=Desulfopila sp. IMCC35006 TaxID=2569542 RepID=UPI0010AD15BF|nr:CHAT domain-containing protein [Desulfopila sp. IMCC35006]TKB26511.1 CHAT domain-containing protein [Desulfopila sp. IMCC35006]
MNKAHQAELFNQEAVRLQSLGYYPQSLSAFQQALELFRKLKDREGEGRCLNGVGALHKDLGEMAKAREYLEQALLIRREVGNLRGESLTLLTLGPVYQYLGELEKALSSLSRSLSLYEIMEDLPSTGMAKYNLGQVYYGQGRLREARQSFADSLQIARTVGNILEEQKCLNALGTACKDLCQYQDALLFFDQGLDLARKLRNHPGEASALHNLGSLYITLGQSGEAEHYLKAALMRYYHLDMVSLTFETHYSLAWLYFDVGNYNNPQMAVPHMLEALEIAQQTGNQYNIAGALNGLAGLYLRLGEFEEGFSLAKQANALYQQLGNAFLQTGCLITLGSLYLSKGEPQEALPCLETALRLAKEVGSSLTEGEAYYNLGALYSSLGKTEQACSMLQEATAIFDRMRYELRGDDFRLSFFNKSWVQESYYVYTAQLIKRSQETLNQSFVAHAFHVCERRHARAFLDLLFSRRVSPKGHISSELSKQEEAMLLELAELQNRLSNPGLSLPDRLLLLDQRTELNSAFQRLLAQISKADSRLAEITEHNPWQVHKIQKLLRNEDTTLLQYSLHNHESYLWVVTGNSLNFYVLPDGLKIKAKVQELLSILIKPNVEGFASCAHDLYQMLLEPAAAVLSGKRLLIVPDHLLHLVPFEVLLIEAPVSQKEQGGRGFRKFWRDQSELGLADLPFLIKKYEIIYSPSATIFAALREDRPTRFPAQWKKDFIGFAPVHFQRDSHHPGPSPLPGTEKEVISISKLFLQNRITLKLGEDASKKAVQSPEISDYRFVHFATHGWADQNNSQFSYLLLAPTDDESALHAFEITTLSLNADLIVLSACETGLGKLHHGEGFVGLMRAFFYAGGQSVLASLWQVHDESTAELMKHFYSFMITKRLDKGSALREAKLAVLQSKEWSSPYYWSAFILSGDWQ